MTSALAATEKRSAPQMSELTPYEHGPALSDATLTDSSLALTWEDSTHTTLPLLWLGKAVFHTQANISCSIRT